jgi:hypothetical protein
MRRQERDPLRQLDLLGGGLEQFLLPRLPQEVLTQARQQLQKLLTEVRDAERQAARGGAGEQDHN